MPGAALQGDVLDPAERLLAPLADLLADRLAGMTGRPAVDGRTPVGRVLGDMRGGVERAQGGDEALRVEALVRSERTE
jgi:hypothetical protein